MNDEEQINITNIGIMLDIESLDLGPRSAVSQIAFQAFDLSDPDTIVRTVAESLPIQPQVALGRTMSFSTIAWWMEQEEKARQRFRDNSGDDMDELLALVKSVNDKLGRVIADVESRGGSYELWAKGPQFDVVNVETLFQDCGSLITPWRYDSVMDLRTLMKLAGLHTDDVDSHDIVKHVALEDVRFQIRCWAEANRRLRSAA